MLTFQISPPNKGNDFLQQITKPDDKTDDMLMEIGNNPNEIPKELESHQNNTEEEDEELSDDGSDDDIYKKYSYG